MNSLTLSSDLAFSSIEGEGPSAGKPVVFLRLSHCNLTCRGWATPENPHGCDSYTAWSQKFSYTFEELFKLFEDRKYDLFIKRGDMLKYSGGEPLIQQKALLEFTRLFQSHWLIPLGDMNIEFETNATILPLDGWDCWVPRYICSPKLANNGDPEEKRYKPNVLQWHAANGSSFFKFVVTSKEDLAEIKEKYIYRFNINPNRIWLMPEGVTTKQLKEKAPWVAEICKEEGFNFSNRLHIFIWEQALGV